MSSRLHNKFHRHNHHTTSVNDPRYPDASYDPIASYTSPFNGPLVVQSPNVSAPTIQSTPNVAVDVAGDIYVSGNSNITVAPGGQFIGNGAGIYGIVTTGLINLSGSPYQFGYDAPNPQSSVLPSLSGQGNFVGSDYSVVAGGSANVINNGLFSFIACGSANTINNTNTFVLGSNITTALNNYTYVNNLSSLGNIYATVIGASAINVTNVIGEGSRITNTVVTGRTIYVDANAGTDTRTGLSQYSAGSPFATLSAAVAASSVATGDLVYVRAGTYAIASQINLNLKGNLYFENGAIVNIASGIVAFSYSQNSVPITIRGYADFILATGATGVLTMPSGNDTTIVNFECSSIVNLTNDSSGTIFNCAAGVLGIDSRLIQAVAAPVFNITGTGKVTSRIPYVYCGVFLNGAGVFGARFNTDNWTVTTYNVTPGIAISSITTNFRMVNYGHFGVGVAYNWSEDTTVEAHGFQGITWNSVNGQPNITFNSSAGSTTSKLIRLGQTNIMRNALTNSLSAALPINVATYGTFAPVPATPNITFKVGSFTVDSDVNNF